MAQHKTSELWDRSIDFTQSEQLRENKSKYKEQNRGDLWDHNKIFNIHITEVPEGEERVGLNKYSKIMAEIFSNLAKHQKNFKLTEPQTG